jgi:putative serine protease PepD
VKGAALTLAAAALLAGCSVGGDDEEAAPATTAAQTSTAPEPSPETAPPPTAVAPPPDPTGSLAEAVDRVLPSVVNVRTSSFGGGKGEASGVILRRDGLILTNNHVVEGTTGVSVAFNDGVHKTPLTATVIGTAPERDLAVIRVKANDLSPVELARSSALRLGDAVIAIGFPAGLLGGPTVTSGIVSGLDRTIEGPNGDLTGLLQTDAAINPGNSGGPLVDHSGRLVGINTAGIRSADTENIGFAIAIDGALPVIAQISDAPPTTEAWLGIAYNSVASESAAVQLGLDSSTRGAAVTEVYPGGPGDAADLAVGDVIVAADDVPIRNAAALTRLIASRKVGDEIDLELIDSRGPRLASVTVAKRTPGAVP